MKTKSKLNTRTVVKAGFLVAISVVLSRFVSVIIPIAGAQGLKVGFAEVPLLLSGFLFGPVIGGLTGVAADLIGFLINSHGAAFHPGITLSSMFWGVIPGIVMLRSKNSKKYSFLKIIITAAMAYILVSVLLTTFWLSQLFGTSMLVLMPLRVLNAAINIPVASIILQILLKYLREFADL